MRPSDLKDYRKEKFSSNLSVRCSSDLFYDEDVSRAYTIFVNFEDDEEFIA